MYLVVYYWMNEVVIIGYSGHAYVVIEAAKEMGIIIKGYAEKDKLNLNPFGLKYYG